MNNGNGQGKAVSPAQLKANRKNALQSTGPRTPEGKAKVRMNALKHGLLAREAVILAGDGKEDLGEFMALLEDLVATLAPDGPLEEMLVERIAGCYWRLCRACRYEIGLLREKLDGYRTDFYGKNLLGERRHYTDAELSGQIKDRQTDIRVCREDRAKLMSMMKEGKPLEETYDCIEGYPWSFLYFNVVDDLKAAKLEVSPDDPRQLHHTLTATLGWSEQRIWQALLGAYYDGMVKSQAELAQRRLERVTTPLALEVARLKRSLPESDDMDQLLRYETATERQFYRAMAQLERQQRQRRGEHLPPPLQVEVTSEK